MTTYNFQKGQDAIKESLESRGGGSFQPFIPRIRWREDGETKYVIVLTPISEVVRVLLHEWIPVGKGERSDGEDFTVWSDFISRKYFGEDYDDLEARLEREPKWRHIGVMVELEPVFETVGDRQKVKELTAKTEEYTRRTDDGDVEVVSPAIGFVTESARTLWGTVGSVDESRGPLTEVAAEIIRRGKDQNTRYDVLPVEGIPVDLTPVIDYVDGISYLGDDHDEVKAVIDGLEPQAAAEAIADALMAKRLHELADHARYEELVIPLQPEDMPKGFGGKGRKKSGNSRRTTQRRREEPETTEESPKAPRDDRFAKLKERVEAGSKK